jgi:hypothetical protein
MAPPSWTISNTSGRNTSESSSTTTSSRMSLCRASSVLMLPHGVGSPRSSRLHLRTYWAIRPSSSARRRPVAPHPTLLDLLFFLHLLVHTRRGPAHPPCALLLPHHALLGVPPCADEQVRALSSRQRSASTTMIWIAATCSRPPFLSPAARSTPSVEPIFPATSSAVARRATLSDHRPLRCCANACTPSHHAGLGIRVALTNSKRAPPPFV